MVYFTSGVNFGIWLRYYLTAGEHSHDCVAQLQSDRRRLSTRLVIAITDRIMRPRSPSVKCHCHFDLNKSDCCVAHLVREVAMPSANAIGVKTVNSAVRITTPLR